MQQTQQQSYLCVTAIDGRKWSRSPSIVYIDCSHAGFNSSMGSAFKLDYSDTDRLEIIQLSQNQHSSVVDCEKTCASYACVCTSIYMNQYYIKLQDLSHSPARSE